MINTMFVLSKGHPNECLTFDWFKKHDFTNYSIVLSYGDDIKTYAKNYGGKIIVAPMSCDSLSKKREWLIKEKTKKNNWIVMLCDNITHVTGMDPTKTHSQKPDRKTLSYEFSPQAVLKIINNELKNIDRNDEIGLFGFASNSNHFFRKTWHSNVGFVWGKMLAFKNNGTPWRHDLIGMEDYAFTAEHLKYSGAVCINKFVYAHDKKVKGTVESRMKEKLYACKVLVEQYNGLYRYKDRPGKPEGSEIQMRFHSLDQIKKWRMSFKIKTGYVKT